MKITLSTSYLVLLITIGIFLFWSFLNKDIPIIDSATFMYVAQSLLSGSIPYRDVFDHKAPMIYLINVFGLVVSGGHIWGIWLLETITVIGSIIFSFYLIKSLYNPKIAFLSTLGWISVFVILLDGGNLTEEYALLFQFGLCWWVIGKKKFQLTHFETLLFGIITSLLFHIRPNLIGIPLAVGMVSLIKIYCQKLSIGEVLRFTLFSGIGFLIIFSLFISYFYYNNALNDYLNYAYRFNTYYTGVPFSNILNVLYIAFFLVVLTPIGLVANIGYLLVFTKAIRIYLMGLPHNKFLGFENKKIVFGELFLIMLLPIEYILVSTSGKIYNHYYIALLPVFTLLAASLLNKLEKQTKTLYYVTFAIFLMYAFFIASQGLQNLLSKKPEPPVINYLKSITNPGDHLLIWGFGSAINIATQTKSPTKYIYQTPLYIKQFQTPQMYFEFLNEIKTNKPQYIIDGVEENEKFPTIDCSPNYQLKNKRDFYPLIEIKLLFKYICENYTIVNTIEHYKIYRIKND